ncbi:MAG: HEAT repeat domain-containing protein [Candidatus Riflebacteria bacterium]|nr:HEAT repeat domain-containing protein [Candidatus Riflebacteria bacterium]
MSSQKITYSYKVILPYSETSNPRKLFKIEYTVEADNRENAIAEAERQFFGYLQYDMASWVRTLDREQIRVWKLSPDLPQTSQSIDELCQRLESSDLDILYQSLRAIGEIQDSTASSRIIKLLSHPDEEIAALAADTLGRIGDPGNVQTLISFFKPATNPRLKASILSSLGKIAGQADPIQDLLASALGDSDSRVRANAVEVIEELFLPRHTRLLLPMLADEDNRVRANVLKALWQCHNRLSLVTTLNDMLENHNPWMRASAAFVLEHIDIENRVNKLSKLLSDPDPVVVSSAWRAVCNINELECMNYWIEYIIKYPEKQSHEIVGKIVNFGSEALKYLYTFQKNQKIKHDILERIIERIEDEIYLKEGLISWLKAKSRRFSGE